MRTVTLVPAVVAVALLAACGSPSAKPTASARPTPTATSAAQAVALDFFAALSDGDADAALALSNYDVADQSVNCPELLTTKVYSKVKNRPRTFAVPTSTFAENTSDLDAGSATYKFSDNTNNFSGTLKLEAGDKDQPLINLVDAWHDPAVTLKFPDGMPLGTVDVNGACHWKVDPKDDMTLSFVAFPGDYTVTFTDDQGIADPVKKKIHVVGPDQTTDVSLSVKPTKGSQTAIETAVHAKVDECAAGGIYVCDDPAIHPDHDSQRPATDVTFDYPAKVDVMPNDDGGWYLRTDMSYKLQSTFSSDLREDLYRKYQSTVVRQPDGSVTLPDWKDC